MKKETVALAGLMGEKVARVVSNGYIHDLLPALEDMFSCVFVHCGPGACPDGGVEPDYNWFMKGERAYMLHTYTALREILRILAGAKGGTISAEAAAQLEAQLEAQQQDSPLWRENMTCALEDMMAAAVIERPIQTAQQPGERERELFFYYRQILEVVRGLGYGSRHTLATREAA